MRKRWRSFDGIAQGASCKENEEGNESTKDERSDEVIIVNVDS